MAGRPRLPTALHLLKNTNPSRMRKQGRDKEIQNTDPLPTEPPEWMNKLQQKYYTEVITKCHKDVLCVSDAYIVCMAAVYIAEMERSKGNLSDRSAGKLLVCLDRLGMTPSARSKVQAIPRDDKKDTPLNEFAA